MQYAISANWIDLSVLKIGDSYYSTEEIYKKLVDYGLKLLEDDTTYSRLKSELNLLRNVPLLPRSGLLLPKKNSSCLKSR